MSQSKRRILVAFGTRPEAIKMAPIVSALRASSTLTPLVGVTAQHRHMLDQVLDLFGIIPDFDLDMMLPDQRLPELTARMLVASERMIRDADPAMVLVHGDTTTTLSVALASFYARVPAAHVEAGLRSGDMHAPWPEEMNRRMATPLCELHFCPTPLARQNLLSEGVAPNDILVTGNTVIDSLMTIDARLDHDPALQSRLASKFPFLCDARRLILVTSHRRENHGAGLESICDALVQLTEKHDVQIAYPVHMSPQVRRVVNDRLSNRKHIHLLEPLDYLSFVHLMRGSHLVLTDSGGIQEEAPSLGKPVLVIRETTERPEAVSAGTAIVVGNETERIVKEAGKLLDDTDAYMRMANASNPYGDGRASQRIVAAIEARFDGGGPIIETSARYDGARR